jgi:hypothetical protein
MDVKRILDNYKRVTQQKEEEERQREAQRLIDEKQRRRLNVGKVAHHLCTVVRPVLEDAQKDIRAAGFPCEVEARSKRNPDISDEDQTFALCLRMTIEKSGTSTLAWLQYAGESDGTALTVTECYPMSTGLEEFPQEKGLRPLSACDQEYVTRQVEDFIGIVFKL